MRTADPRSALFVLALFAASLTACERPAEDMPETAPAAVEETEDVAEPQAADPIAGEHHMPSGAHVIAADGAYTVYDGDDVIVEGTYTIDGSIVTFVDHAGPQACIGQPGVYELGPEEGQLTLIEDPCDGRRADITGEAAEADES